MFKKTLHHTLTIQKEAKALRLVMASTPGFLKIIEIAFDSNFNCCVRMFSFHPCCWCLGFWISIRNHVLHRAFDVLFDEHCFGIFNSSESRCTNRRRAGGRNDNRCRNTRKEDWTKWKAEPKPVTCGELIKCADKFRFGVSGAIKSPLALNREDQIKNKRRRWAESMNFPRFRGRDNRISLSRSARRMWNQVFVAAESRIPATSDGR